MSFLVHPNGFASTHSMPATPPRWRYACFRGRLWENQGEALKGKAGAVAQRRGVMGSTIGGDDPLHDLPEDRKRELEKRIRKEARDKYLDDPKRRKKEDDRANEISRRKSKRAHR